jgi:energy-coupling factor transport system substrate-specific component
MFTTPRLIVIALCAALNFAIGTVVYLIKLPIYLDSVGTGLLVNPFLPWFWLTVVAIARVSAYLTAEGVATYRARPMPTGAFVARVVCYGIVTGLVAAIVSAPVVAYLFGGVTGSGSTFIVALFLKAGQQLLSAALLSGLAAEPVDKTLQVLLAALLYRATPADFIAMLQGEGAERTTR